jgi:photosystem II stability/assembly factor-like uncharacterized protein
MQKKFKKFNQRGSVSVQSALLIGVLATGSVVGGVAYADSQSASYSSGMPTSSENPGMCVTAAFVSDLKTKSNKGDCPIDEPTAAPTSNPAPIVTSTPTPTAPQPTSTPIVTPSPEPTPTPTIAPPSIGSNAGISTVVDTSTSVGLPSSVATSIDGSKIVAIQSKKIFSSNDYGQTWKLLVDISTSIAGMSISFNAVTPSKDGTSFYVAPGAVGSPSSIWFYKIDATKASPTATSMFLNSGDVASFGSIDVSDSGAKFIASRSDGYMYRTGGVTSWIKGSYTGISQLAASADGTKAVSVATNGSVYKSTDSGTTWTKLTQPSVQKWVSIDSDAAGDKWFATTQSGNVFHSTDMGATWIPHDVLGVGSWSNISVSNDGKVIAVGKTGAAGQVYFSKDGGGTWSTSSALSGGYWSLVKVSSDGHRFYAKNNKSLKTGVID